MRAGLRGVSQASAPPPRLLHRLDQPKVQSISWRLLPDAVDEELPSPSTAVTVRSIAEEVPKGRVLSGKGPIVTAQVCPDGLIPALPDSLPTCHCSVTDDTPEGSSADTVTVVVVSLHPADPSS